MGRLNDSRLRPIPNASILVTGFGPFLHHSTNPSTEILPLLQSQATEFFRENLPSIAKEWCEKNRRPDSKASWVAPRLIETVSLPVSFKDSFKCFKDKIESISPPRVVLLIGLAEQRENLSLERVAQNWIETQNPDIDHFVPERGPIFPSKDNFENLMPLQSLADYLNQESALQFEVSSSAGHYVCNFLYFKVLDYLPQSEAKILFLHIPNNKSLSQMVTSILRLLLVMYNL